MGIITSIEAIQKAQCLYTLLHLAAFTPRYSELENRLDETLFQGLKGQWTWTLGEV